MKKFTYLFPLTVFISLLTVFSYGMEPRRGNNPFAAKFLQSLDNRGQQGLMEVDTDGPSSPEVDFADLTQGGTHSNSTTTSVTPPRRIVKAKRGMNRKLHKASTSTKKKNSITSTPTTKRKRSTDNNSTINPNHDIYNEVPGKKRLKVMNDMVSKAKARMPHFTEKNLKSITDVYVINNAERGIETLQVVWACFTYLEKNELCCDSEIGGIVCKFLPFLTTQYGDKTVKHSASNSTTRTNSREIVNGFGLPVVPVPQNTFIVTKQSVSPAIPVHTEEDILRKLGGKAKGFIVKIFQLAKKHPYITAGVIGICALGLAWQAGLFGAMVQAGADVNTLSAINPGTVGKGLADGAAEILKNTPQEFADIAIEATKHVQELLKDPEVSARVIEAAQNVATNAQDFAHIARQVAADPHTQQVVRNLASLYS